MDDDDSAGPARRLAQAGFISADDEARELVTRAGGDRALLETLVERRLTGEPLAWITGRVSFCGLDVRIDPGVYVPRWQSEPLARRAAARLPGEGAAVDVCTGTGAIARTLSSCRPSARVVATDIDERAVRCAASNGVDARRGDLLAPLDAALEGSVDVVVGVVPYVPTEELGYLQRDTFTFETTLAYDGGRDGADILRRVVRDAVRFLRDGGALLLELGGDQDHLLRDDLERTGYGEIARIVDDDGFIRGIETTFHRRC